MAVRVASSEAINRFIEHSTSWSYENHRLYRKFEFSDFQQAFEFMAAIASYAERVDHHPEWCNVYNVVRVWLTTHSLGDVSTKDFALAQEMERLINKR